jgi:hypothetical protein
MASHKRSPSDQASPIRRLAKVYRQRLELGYLVLRTQVCRIGRAWVKVSLES